MYAQFYSWENILRRLPSGAGQAVAYLEFNLLYRKFGKLTCHLGRAFGMRRLAKLAKALAYPVPAVRGRLENNLPDGVSSPLGQPAG